MEESLEEKRRRRRWELNGAKIVCALCILSSISIPILERSLWSANVLLSWIVFLKIGQCVSRTFGNDVQSAQFRIYLQTLCIQIACSGWYSFIYSYLSWSVKEIGKNIWKAFLFFKTSPSIQQPRQKDFRFLFFPQPQTKQQSANSNISKAFF